MIQIDDALVPLTTEHKEIVAKLQGINRITLLRQLGGGAPETRVYLVDVEAAGTGGAEGTWVLKLDATWRARQEVASQKLLETTALRSYLPTLQQSIFGSAAAELSVQLSSLATGTFLNSRTLEQSLQHSTYSPARVIGRLARILLTEWNGGCQHSTIKLGPYLKDCVKRLSEEGGAGRQKLEAVVDLTAIRLEGPPLKDRWLPNPLALIADLPEKAAQYGTRLPIGHVHGDLHPGNVLHAPATHDSDDSAQSSLSLIDVATYREGNVCFDLAYLEMSMLWHLFERFESPVARSAWWQLVEHLSSELTVTVGFDGIGRANDAMALIRPLRSEIQRHAHSVFRKDDYWLAFLLASIETGLTFAFSPERIAKDPASHASLQLAGLLSAGSALRRLLEVVGAWLPVQDEAHTQTASVLKWGRSQIEDESPPPAVVAQFDAFARGTLASLRAGHCILIVGDRFANDVMGILGDGVVMRRIGPQFGAPEVAAGGDANVGSLDRLPGEEFAKQHAVATLFDSIPRASVPGLANLGAIKWSAIIGWSFSPALYRELDSPTSRARYVRVFCDGSSDPDFSASTGIPYIALRGSVDEFKRLALGVRGWTRQNSTRRRILSALFSALPFKPTILFVGFEKSTLEYVRTEICDVVGIIDNVWVVRHSFTSEDRTFLESSRGFGTAEISPKHFVDFCGYVSRGRRRADAVTAGQRVLEIRGIQRVVNERGAVVFRRADVPEAVTTVGIAADEFDRLEKHIEILHKDLLSDPDEQKEDGGIGDFYLGHIVEWREIAQGLAFWRTYPGDAVMKAVSTNLLANAPRRISLWYQPGAGATTLLRNMAFKLYFEDQVPTAFLRHHSRDTYGEVVKFYNHFKRSFVLFADEQDVSRGDADLLFGRLQDRQVPVVLVYATRSSHSKDSLRKATQHPEPDKQRRFFLIDEITQAQKLELAGRLEAYFGPVQAARCRDGSHDSLFLTLLETFESDFTMVEEIVGGMLAGTDGVGRAAAADLSFVWYYGHKWMYESVLATLHGCSPQEIAGQLEALEDRLLWLERRDGERIWFPRHDLLAEAVIGIQLGSARPQGTPLKEYAVELIQRLSGHPEAVSLCRDIVWALVGTDREQALWDEMEIGSTGVRALPSRLLRSIQSISGQDEVWQAVIEAFPSVPLFLAHYGRFLYGRDVQRYTDSEAHLRKASELSEERDNTILHMLGMRFRSELQYVLRLRRQERDSKQAGEMAQRSQFLAGEAASYFQRSIDAAPTEEHGYVSYIQLLCVLTNDKKARQSSGDDPRAVLLDEEVQAWVRKAHDLVHSSEINIAGAYYSEYLTKARGNLRNAEGTLDNVIAFDRAALQRPALANSSMLKDSLSHALLRRGMERYGAEPIDNRWSEDFTSAVTFLSDSLRDAPYDTRRIELWFRCARFCPDTSRIELIQRLEDLWREAKTLEGAFYLFCLHFIEGLERASLPDFERA